MLLPNGWTLTPEGTQIPVSDLPLNMALSRDGRHLLVTTNGNGDQTIDVIDLSVNRSVQAINVRKSWLGLVFAPDGNRFFVSGGDDNEILVFDFAAGAPLSRVRYFWAAANIMLSTTFSVRRLGVALAAASMPSGGPRGHS